jgi:hypothetical protein
MIPSDKGNLNKGINRLHHPYPSIGASLRKFSANCPDVSEEPSDKLKHCMGSRIGAGRERGGLPTPRLAPILFSEVAIDPEKSVDA